MRLRSPATASSRRRSAPPPRWEGPHERWTPATSPGRQGVIVVDVSASWCHWCHVMEQGYADPQIRRVLDAAFLPVSRRRCAPDLAGATPVPRRDRVPDARRAPGRRDAPPRSRRLPRDPRARARGRARRTLTDLAPRGAAPARAGEVDLGPRRPPPAVVGASGTAAGRVGLRSEIPAADRGAFPGAAHGRSHGALGWTCARRSADHPWTGMYQYSRRGLGAPALRRIVSVQAGASPPTRSGSRTLARTRSGSADLATLRSPRGTFLPSQDADVGAHGDAPFLDGHDWFARDAAGRRLTRAPRVDPAVYAQENGWAAKALVDLFAAAGDERARDEAAAALEGVLATHADPRGGLRHAASDAGALHAGDTVAVGRACLALSQATGDAAWLAQATRLADDLVRLFGDGDTGGFFGADDHAGSPHEALRDGAAAAHLIAGGATARPVRRAARGASRRSRGRASPSASARERRRSSWRSRRRPTPGRTRCSWPRGGRPAPRRCGGRSRRSTLRSSRGSGRSRGRRRGGRGRRTPPILRRPSTSAAAGSARRR